MKNKSLLLAMLITGILAVVVIFAFSLMSDAQTPEPSIVIHNKAIPLRDSVCIKVAVFVGNATDADLLVREGAQSEYTL